MMRAIAIAILFVFAAPLSAQQVARVIDGDTIVVASVGTVRLIGVDTPETVDTRQAVQRFGAEASAFLKQLLTDKIVRLEFDQSRQDRFGRTLAYVFLADGRMVNAEIVRQGYGHAYLAFPFKHLDQFRALEREARLAKRGLWADAPDAAAPTTMFVNANSRVYHHAGCRYVTADSRPIAFDETATRYRACRVCKPPRP